MRTKTKSNSKQAKRSIPMSPKAGVTMSGLRRYDKGGKVYKCGGKIKK